MPLKYRCCRAQSKCTHRLWNPLTLRSAVRSVQMTVGDPFFFFCLMFYLNLTFPSCMVCHCLLATCHGRGLLLLCFNPTRAGCCCESISAQRCKVQRMGLAAHYARLIGASSRTWVGIHLHESRLAERRNPTDIMKRIYLFIFFFFGGRKKNHFQERKKKKKF